MNRWDLGKFIDTLNYFDVIPVVGDLRRFFMGEKPVNSDEILSKQMVGKVLLVGNDRSIEEEIRSTLKELKYQLIHVKTLEDLTNEYPKLSAIIYLGDRQNPIDPAHLVNLCRQSLQNIDTKLIFDFTNNQSELAQLWGAVDDVVMGGVSNSMLKINQQTAIFSGYVSIENSGGFASVRTRNFEPPLDWRNYQGISLKIKGDGKRYKLILRCANSWDGIGYTCSFDTINNQWITVNLPFDQLIPVFRAKTVNNAVAIDLQNIYAMQIMLSKFEYDGQLNPHFQPGIFTLQIASIAIYRPPNYPQFIIIDPESNTNKYSYLIQSIQETGTIVQETRLFREIGFLPKPPKSPNAGEHSPCDRLSP